MLQLVKQSEGLSISQLAPVESIEIQSNTSKSEFFENVARCKEHIRAGDAFQIVLSQRFVAPVAGDSFDVYRMLRANNPSPYMYFMRIGTSLDEDASVWFDIVGSSPEALVKLHNGMVEMHPIAGTRRRGATSSEDDALEADLLQDAKERAEHLMLVDLGRNDLGRISVPGTVEVSQFMTVEKYSHVMHLVS
jgi:anthranilate synthase component 1